MNSYMSEVMPAVAAMIVMGLVAFLLFIVFETVRSHVQTARRTKKARVAERPATAADTLGWGEKTEAVEEPPVSEIAFDGDVGMFEGDFADAPQSSSFPVKADTQDSVGDDGAFFGEAEEPGQNPQPAALASPELSKIAQDLSRNRDGKQNRRERDANNERRDRKAEKQRQRAGKERDAAPDDARKVRQQNKRQNRQ